MSKAVSARLTDAVRSDRGVSGHGLREHLFAWAFKGLVYPQIWEDPDVDMEALAITPDCHVVAIASGGCNVLSYLLADPKQITAVDLNTAHVALNRLKLAAAAHLPSWDSFYRFFGSADEAANVKAYWRHIAPVLDAASRAYWEKRDWRGRPRISLFARNFYRYGLLGRFIGFGHLLARAYGVNPKDLLNAGSLAEQRSFFEAAVAPLFDKRLIRWVAARPVSLYGLGIPPMQYDALAGGSDMASVLRERLERLTCGFSLSENYFAWQAFGRAYGDAEAAPLPPYLRRNNFEAIRARAGAVEVLNASLTDYLAACPDASRDRYVLLDAQDWMTDAKLNALWREITRTARPGARVIFRTAAKPDLLPGRVDPAILEQWRYEAGPSAELTRRDRSAIYGGFHLYVRR